MCLGVGVGMRKWSILSSQAHSQISLGSNTLIVNTILQHLKDYKVFL